MKEAVKCNIGIAVLPRRSVVRETASGELICRDLPGYSNTGGYASCTGRKNRCPPAFADLTNTSWSSFRNIDRKKENPFSAKRRGYCSRIRHQKRNVILPSASWSLTIALKRKSSRRLHSHSSMPCSSPFSAGKVRKAARRFKYRCKSA
ncbi:hypothetical protein [Paenibacillus macerans]|uniref:hypothetical protein n=1 Tax=Paenibacillus macerans TaxID=44252 RepID=UPI0037C538E6